VKLRGKKKLDWVIYKIDVKEKEIQPEKTSSDEKVKGIEGLVKNLPSMQPRYAIYDHEFKTNDGRSTSKLYFFSFTPTNSNQLDRVIYAQSMKPFRDSLSGIFPVSFNTPNEILLQFKPEAAEEEEEDEDEDFA